MVTALEIVYFLVSCDHSVSFLLSWNVLTHLVPYRRTTLIHGIVLGGNLFNLLDVLKLRLCFWLN